MLGISKKHFDLLYARKKFQEILGAKRFRHTALHVKSLNDVSGDAYHF